MILNDKIKTFLVAAELKNYTKASYFLNMTQPAVSKHIKAIEENYQIKLFKKVGKNIELTYQGQLLYKNLIQIERLCKETENLISESKKIHSKHHIGATLTIGGYLMGPILSNYKKESPFQDIILHVENTETVMQNLIKNNIELGVIEGPVNQKDVIIEFFEEDELVYIVSKKDPLSQKESISLQEAIENRLILREQGSGTRKIIEEYIEKMGFSKESLKAYMEIGDIRAILSLVKEGIGSSIISKRTIDELSNKDEIKTLQIEGLIFKRSFNFIYLKRTEFVRNFISFCKTYRNLI